MTRRLTIAGLMAGLWCVLAVWQSYRSFARCEASGWAGVFWALLVLALAAPILTMAYTTRNRDIRRDLVLDPAVTLALLGYVPVVIAMRLVELCISSR
jgi:hypothetical protein